MMSGNEGMGELVILRRHVGKPTLERDYPEKKSNWCPCGGVIWADTEEWTVPICVECWEELGMPQEEPKNLAEHMKALVPHVRRTETGMLGEVGVDHG